MKPPATSAATGTVTAPLFPDLPVPEATPVRSARARRAWRRVDARDYRPAPLPQPEGRSAQYWCAQMLAAPDAARKDFCHAMMIASVLALDHTSGRH